MYGGLARFVVRPGMREEFLDLLRWDAQVARDSEPGTLRLDVWEVDTEPGVIYVYEVYTSPEAFEVHIKNEPVRKFAQIMDSLIEGWTMVIPFRESITSNTDG
jgi:(4S)-4-hydroxy-5-phosphonooxypentane-2,3-dione isomerase